MKRSIALVLLLTMIFSLSACSVNEPFSDTGKDEKPKETEPQIKVAEVYKKYDNLVSIGNFVKLLVVDRWLMGNAEVTVQVAVVICLTLLCTVFCAKVVGCLLPLLAEKIGLDPAVMAAPFITTIVDVLSLVIYFRFAIMMLGL